MNESPIPMIENFISMDREGNKPTTLVTIEPVKGDITKREVDIIVNTGHEGVTGGGGVDGAIHKAAGHQLLGECLQLYGCGEGEARFTGAYDLPAKYIIHTVGPIWSPDKEQQEKDKKILADCYKNCLEIAERQGMKSIAFPCISTGAFCFPKPLAAEIAVQTVWRWLRDYIMHQRYEERVGCYLQLVEFVCFDDENLELYEKAIAKEEEHWNFPICHRIPESVVCSYIVGDECRHSSPCWMDRKDEKNGTTSSS